MLRMLVFRLECFYVLQLCSQVIQYNVYFAQGGDGLNRHLTNYNVSIVMSSDGDAGASGVGILWSG